jgi:hypothetical protein
MAYFTERISADALSNALLPSFPNKHIENGDNSADQ